MHPQLAQIGAPGSSPVHTAIPTHLPHLPGPINRKRFISTDIDVARNNTSNWKASGIKDVLPLGRVHVVEGSRVHCCLHADKRAAAERLFAGFSGQGRSELGHFAMRLHGADLVNVSSRSRRSKVLDVA